MDANSIWQDCYFWPESKPVLEESVWYVTPELKRHKPKKIDARKLTGQWVALPRMEGDYKKVAALTGQNLKLCPFAKHELAVVHTVVFTSTRTQAQPCP